MSERELARYVAELKAHIAFLSERAALLAAHLAEKIAGGGIAAARASAHTKSHRVPKPRPNQPRTEEKPRDRTAPLPPAAALAVAAQVAWIIWRHYDVLRPGCEGCVRGLLRPIARRDPPRVEDAHRPRHPGTVWHD